MKITSSSLFGFTGRILDISSNQFTGSLPSTVTGLRVRLQYVTRVSEQEFHLNFIFGFTPPQLVSVTVRPWFATRFFSYCSNNLTFPAATLSMLYSMSYYQSFEVCALAQSETSALLDLFASTAGPSWLSKVGWLSGITDPCQSLWFGTLRFP